MWSIAEVELIKRNFQHIYNIYIYMRDREERNIVQGVIKRKFTFREKMIKEASGKVEGLNDEMTPI